LSGRPWRVVEAQHVVSTRKLVDSLEEQEELERMIDERKPPLPAEPAFAGLHYLLATPFRYPPLAHGSRFATRYERSLWYGSREIRAAFAETAYYRLLFLAGTTAELGPLAVDLTAFRVRVHTARGVDLTAEPFRGYEARISSPTSYRDSQALGRAMRQSGVEAFRFRSARDHRGGVNLGLFTPAAFAARRPESLQTWHGVADGERVEFSLRSFFERAAYRFDRAEFEIGGRLPAPAP